MTDRIKGSLSVMGSIAGALAEVGTMTGSIGLPSTVRPESYDGDYGVTPRLTEQILATNRKYMTDDVTIHEIPITSTSNPQGGQTVLIG